MSKSWPTTQGVKSARRSSVRSQCSITRREPQRNGHVMTFISVREVPDKIIKKYALPMT
jgi:hypothetical protein